MLAIESVSVSLDDQPVLDGVSLDVAQGEVVSVLGPSGGGKTTLLRTIIGLHAPDSGRVLLDGVDLARVPVHRRGIGYVFQDRALFRHRDVGGNVAFGLEMQGVEHAATGSRVAEVLALAGLADYERRSVRTLSGGEAQRVALARALAPSPRVLLLDEPLASLDRPLRERLQEDLARLFETLSVTAVYVTHDRAEAFALGDRVAIMRDGSFTQVGTPDELWARPIDSWTARFLGMENLWKGKVVRPEGVEVRPAVDGGDGVVESAVRAGATVVLRVRLDTGETLEAVDIGLEHPEPGDRITVSIDPAGIVELA